MFDFLCWPNYVWCWMAVTKAFPASFGRSCPESIVAAFQQLGMTRNFQSLAGYSEPRRRFGFALGSEGIRTARLVAYQAAQRV